MRTLHRSFRLALGTAVLTFPTLATAQTYVIQRVAPETNKGFSDVHVSKAAAPGEQVRIWWATMLNPDCTPQGTMKAEIIDAPRHGRATVDDGDFYPNYVSPNPRAICDAHKVPGKQAFYTASDGYRGHDRVVIRNATSEGRIRNIIVDIAVR